MERFSLYWRNREQLLRMKGSNCVSCGIKHFPPKDVCPDCGHVQGQIARDLIGIERVRHESEPEKITEDERSFLLTGLLTREMLKTTNGRENN